MKNKMTKTSRILLLISGLSLIIVLFAPIWRIDLDAPQYPEGLRLQIYANGLRGNVDIINGLNHYIGMKTLHSEDFFEFTILPYCILFFVIAFICTALFNRRGWLYIVFSLFVAFGIIAMIDFWQWEYNYGHNLNPDAAIIVPGMAYQPPLIGFKQLLNFGAYSIPDTGGWLFIEAGVLVLTAVVLEWRKIRVVKKQRVSSAMVMLFVVFSLSSCQQGPEPIQPGRDNCYFCKMGISDSKYATELLTKKGRAYKFDDAHCLLSFLKTKSVTSTEIKNIYLADFAGDHQLIESENAFCLQGGDIHAPMNGNIAAFQSKDSLLKANAQLKALETTWKQIEK